MRAEALAIARGEDELRLAAGSNALAGANAKPWRAWRHGRGYPVDEVSRLPTTRSMPCSAASIATSKASRKS
jgi:hypothetical protein